MQDHQRAALLASSQSNFDPSGQPEVLPDTLIPLTHVQEERKLREEVTRAFHTAIPASGAGSRVVKGKGKGEGEDEDEVEDEDEDDFLVTKTSLQVDDAEAKKYRDFLLAQAGGEEGVREILGMGGFPERMQGQNQGKRDIKVVEGEEDAGDTIADVDDAEGREGKGGDRKRVRTKDDDEEFLMKSVPLAFLISPLKPQVSFDLVRKSARKTSLVLIFVIVMRSTRQLHPEPRLDRPFRRSGHHFPRRRVQAQEASSSSTGRCRRGGYQREPMGNSGGR